MMQFLGYFLLAWYCVFIFFIPIELWSNPRLMLIGIGINLLCISFISQSIYGKGPWMQYIVIGTMLLIWFAYYTIVDAKGCGVLSSFYTFIDVSTFIFISFSLSEKMLFPLLHGKYIDKIRYLFCELGNQIGNIGILM